RHPLTHPRDRGRPPVTPRTHALRPDPGGRQTPRTTRLLPSHGPVITDPRNGGRTHGRTVQPAAELAGATPRVATAARVGAGPRLAAPTGRLAAVGGRLRFPTPRPVDHPRCGRRRVPLPLRRRRRD